MSAAPPVDAAARSRIENDLRSNLCVEAGAGTGKTTVLVRRVVALLREGHASVDELAVITFTEKAAGELSARVRFALEQELDAAARESDEHARLATALAGLYRARIQTIHAFASDLLRERPVEARLDPQFETMDDVTSDVRFEQAYRRWLDEQLATRNLPIERALRRGFYLDRLRQLVEAVNRNREALPLAPLATHPPDVAVFRALVSGWAARLTELEPRCTEQTDGAFELLGPLRVFCDKVVTAHGEDEVERLALFEAPRVAFNVGQAGNWDDGACEQVRDLFREYRPAIEELRAALRTDALAGVLPLAAAFARVLRRGASRGRAGRLRRPADLGARPAARRRARSPPLPPPHHARAGGRVPGHRSRAGRAGHLAVRARGSDRPVARDRARARGHCSWSATPSSRSTASAAPTSRSTTRSRAGRWAERSSS